jgi:hypothetical protein
MTHWMLASEACRSPERSCRATLTIVVSSTDMIAPMITTIAIRITCGSIREAGKGSAEVSFTGISFGVKRLATKYFVVKVFAEDRYN